MDPKPVGSGKLIAFTNTNHYEPHVVTEYWFGGDENKVRSKQEGRFEVLPFAIVLKRGKRYASGLHGTSEAIPLMGSLDQPDVLLYEDSRGRLWFCACEDVKQNTARFQPMANEDVSDGTSPVSHEDGKEVRGPVRTILFTDIEGSTQITNTLGDKKARKLFRKHDEIIGTAVSTYGGIKTKPTGDGMMAEFPAPSAAIDAAITMQRDIMERFAGEPTTLRIRIGINTGEPIADAGDLHGASVNLAARVTDQGDGGQILVTETVRNLVSGKPYEFVEHGPRLVTLAGFADPIRLFEVLWTQEKLLILGLAGKAGSGFDSDIVDILKRRGFEIIRTDKIADAAWEQPEVRRAVAKTFGKEEIFDNASQEDPSKWVRKRGVLGEIVASDPVHAERLSDILNPYATAQTFAQIRKLVEAGKRHIALASTRLTNKEQKLFCHQIWYVDRSDSQRQKALVKDYSGRRQLAEEYISAKVDQIMRLQRDVIEPSSFPYDLVIEHPENEEALTQKVTSQLHKVLLAEQRSINGAKEFAVGQRRGQFVRSILSLAQIMGQPIRLKGENLFSPASGNVRGAIRACIDACVNWSGGSMRVAKKDWAIEFWPGRDVPSEVWTFKLTNELSVSLLVVTLIPLCLHRNGLFQFVLQGCTDLNHSSPCDYYKNVLFPLLGRLGIDVRLEVEKRGFWGGDLGSIRLSVQGTTSLRRLDLTRKGEPQSIKFSHSSVGLDKKFDDRFVKKMSEFCKEVGFTGARQFEINSDVGGHGKSASMSVAIATEYSILGADAVCDKASDHLAHEETMSRLLERTRSILASPAALDYFTADKIMLYLARAGGAVTIPITDDMEHIYAQLGLISWFHKGRIDIKCSGKLLFVEMDPML